MVITDLGVFSVRETGLILTDLYEPYTVEEVRKRTEASFDVAEQLRILQK
jgi:acetate CoA/acetoacetate CoA-transferase beta subunit